MDPALPLPEPALYVIIGAAGSGKTHIAAAFPRSWRLSLDACRARVAGNFSVKFCVSSRASAWPSTRDGGPSWRHRVRLVALCSVLIAYRV